MFMCKEKACKIAYATRWCSALHIYMLHIYTHTHTRALHIYMFHIYTLHIYISACSVQSDIYVNLPTMWSPVYTIEWLFLLLIRVNISTV